MLSMVEQVVTVICGEETGAGLESSGDDSSILEFDMQFRLTYRAQQWVRDIGQKDRSEGLEECDGLRSFARQIPGGFGQYEVTQGKGNLAADAGQKQVTSSTVGRVSS
jgi:hypothetical protein